MSENYPTNRYSQDKELPKMVLSDVNDSIISQRYSETSITPATTGEELLNTLKAYFDIDTDLATTIEELVTLAAKNGQFVSENRLSLEAIAGGGDFMQLAANEFPDSDRGIELPGDSNGELEMDYIRLAAEMIGIREGYDAHDIKDLGDRMAANILKHVVDQPDNKLVGTAFKL